MTVLIEVTRGFLGQSRQMSRRQLKLGRDRFLPQLFQYIFSNQSPIRVWGDTGRALN
jgi:hypothetical protein